MNNFFIDFSPLSGPRLTSSYDGTVKICSTTDWKVVKVGFHPGKLDGTRLETSKPQELEGEDVGNLNQWISKKDDFRYECEFI